MTTRTAIVGVDPRLEAIAAVQPPSRITTDELLWEGRTHFSERLRHMMGRLGVEARYSALSNYTDVLFRNAEPKVAATSADLAVRSARECVARAGADPAEIGLVLGVTSSPGRLLPCVVCDIVARMPELPRDVPNLAMQYMGCSVMAKAVEVARWYLTSNPHRRVLVCFVETITAMSPALPRFYRYFSEVGQDERQSTVDAMHAFLFGDAAVSMLLSAEGDGPSFSLAAHLTNERADDTELGTVPDGGSDLPVVRGRRQYTLSPGISSRGAHYVERTVRALIERGGSGLDSPRDASMFLVHTGSAQILNGLCNVFGVPPGSEKAAPSYRVLREHANTLGCSVPLMLAAENRQPPGVALLVAFGLSFSCGAFTMRVPAAGWICGRS